MTTTRKRILRTAAVILGSTVATLTVATAPAHAADTDPPNLDVLRAGDHVDNNAVFNAPAGCGATMQLALGRGSYGGSPGEVYALVSAAEDGGEAPLDDCQISIRLNYIDRDGKRPPPEWLHPTLDAGKHKTEYYSGHLPASADMSDALSHLDVIVIARGKPYYWDLGA